jgi:phosphate transport system protein
MAIHFFREIDWLKQRLLALSAIVEEALTKAVRSVEEEDVELARAVMASDSKVDQMEVDLEEDCLKILALYQPVAADLRFIIAALKINNDLERIGDLAVNIAERAVSLHGCPRPGIQTNFDKMTVRVQEMLKKCLDSLVHLDAGLAREVCAADDEVDACLRDMFALAKERICRNPDPENVNVLVQLLSVSRHLERVADHTTNIAEDLIYMIEGNIIRHRGETAGKAPARSAQ